jgi:hypothetical protein
MYRNGIRKYFFRACCTVCAIAITPIATGLRAIAQTPSTNSSFEVATIKPIDPSYRFDGKHHWVHVNPAGASYWYMTLDSLITPTMSSRSRSQAQTGRTPNTLT